MADPQLTILAVDDNQDNLTVLRAIVRDSLPDCRFLAALNGEDGLTLARTEDPDVILLDIAMPGMDGFEVCRRLKEDEDLHMIPVVFLTAHRTDRASRLKALEAGAEGFLTKPCEQIELIAQIRAMAKIKASMRVQRIEKEQLATLATERMDALEHELAVRKQVEVALRENEERLRLALDAASAGTWEWVLETNKNIWSNELWRLYGLDQRAWEASYEAWRESIHPDDRATVEAAVTTAARDGTEINIEWRVNTPGASTRWLMSRGKPQRNAAGRVVAYRGIVVDITERKRAEAAVAENEARFRGLFSRMPSGVAVYETREEGEDFVIKDMNRSSERLCGVTRDQIVGRPVGEVFPSVRDFGLFEVLQRVWRTGVPERLPVALYQDNRIAEWFENEVYKLPSGEVVAMFDDVTEKKQAEEELARYRGHLEQLVEERTRELASSRERLARAERLASIGTLAAGIAHEINNPLGMMLLGADLALRSMDNPDTLVSLLHQQKSEVERCAHIVRGVLDFARQRPSEKWPLELNDVIRHGMEFTREYARLHGVHVETALAESPCPIMGNLTELEQVVVNLVNNAVQACRPGGLVTAETHHSGGRVRLLVRDNGHGMTPEQIEHAFDPFYTTRLEKGGTGLGLSTVHGIVVGHGGTITITSTPGRGAAFIIELPKRTVADTTVREPTGEIPAAV